MITPSLLAASDHEQVESVGEEPAAGGPPQPHETAPLAADRPQRAKAARMLEF